MNGIWGSTPLTHQMDQDLGMNQDEWDLGIDSAHPPDSPRSGNESGWMGFGDRRSSAEPRCRSPTGWANSMT
ncbi:hypothetical protein [Sphingobacterium mizutaii]|uniref:hypothetical protein n=1 Tax=Sphingobacterium mizutaii TaxID=1010 RepID=UPI000B884D23|nr:hypothetical protein [Sphingobacterium mizutaii]